MSLIKQGSEAASTPDRDDGATRQTRPMRVGSFRWWFENRETGTITVAQAPNPPLLVAFAGILGARLADGGLADGFRWLGTAGIAWWAVDEIVRGVNPWRRVLGLGGVGWVVLRVLG